MPGLNQEGIIAYKRLRKNLAIHGHVPAPKTPALWRHITHPIYFILCVDYFGIKYVRKQHVTYLLNALKEQYDISIDYKGDSYCGLTIAWNYAKKYVDISIPGYTKKYLQRFKHTEVQQVEDAPASYKKPVFGSKKQWADNLYA